MIANDSLYAQPWALNMVRKAVRDNIMQGGTITVSLQIICKTMEAAKGNPEYFFYALDADIIAACRQLISKLQERYVELREYCKRPQYRQTFEKPEELTEIINDYNSNIQLCQELTGKL